MQSHPSNADRETAGMRYENILNKRLTKHLIEVKGKYKQNFGTFGNSERPKKKYVQNHIRLQTVSLQFNGKR